MTQSLTDLNVDSNAISLSKPTAPPLEEKVALDRGYPNHSSSSDDSVESDGDSSSEQTEASLESSDTSGSDSDS